MIKMSDTKRYEAMENALYAQARNEYERLSFGIILRAIRDYRLAERHDNVRLKRDCEQFFRSRWFGMLIDLPGDDILDRLKEESGEKTEINYIDIPRLRSRQQVCV